MPMSAFFDIYIGDRKLFAQQQASYDATRAFLAKNANIYGLPADPAELSQEQQSIVAETDKSFLPLFEPPQPLCVGRLVFELSSHTGVSKTVANFKALCTGEKGMCKNAPNKKLWYHDTPVHRIVKGFVAQGGDVTRGDGSGGDSIYGGKFNDEKEGLKAKFVRGTLAMANSGKNSNTSQFFLTLTNDTTKLAKMNGKYVVFGQLKEGFEVLDKLDDIGSADGKPAKPVWIGECGLL